jgi:hypothetical protein
LNTSVIIPFSSSDGSIFIIGRCSYH